ncbi:DUF6153 family protein [Streptomyces sp. SID9727]|uniref:DUF6153 family protein n=1 Tax=Streptomyces sp. SID9727 TaxID=2706114 RepID=UPI0013CADBCF|nr:DUF6153 family protein [Streptomyces sp. SID9727]NEC68753.1 hypothetical protein [Streptomyces sp. SID9727]
MASSAQRTSRRPAGRLSLLLVWAVLTGVWGMHAFGPGGALPEAGRHAMAMTTTAEHASHPPSGCSRTDGGGPEHLAHADASCVAAGIGSAYAPPPLAGALPDAPLTDIAPARRADSAESGRAPPDLSELQLLRI